MKFVKYCNYWFQPLILKAFLFIFLIQNTEAQKPEIEKLRIVRAPKPGEPVIIIGGGLSGLSATLEALKHGSNIVLFDKEKDLGGNSIKASSGMYFQFLFIYKNTIFRD